MKSRQKSTNRLSKPSRGKAPAYVVLVLFLSVVLAISPLLQAGQVSPFSSSRKSGNGCDCHGTTYTEYVIINNYSIPSELLIGQTFRIYANVTVNSTAYYPAKSTYWLCDVTVTVTSVKGMNKITGSPKTNNSVLPGFQREYVFSMTGSSAGTDTIKIEAKLRTHHYGRVVTDTVTGSALVIKPRAPPTLLSGKVSPTTGYNQTDFTYRVTYMDDDGDPPTSIAVIIDDKAPRPMALFDGSLDTVLTGEDYFVKVNGTNLGLGNHTFRFIATEGVFNATGDNWTHQGPKVAAYIAPNKPPTVTIQKPTTGSSILGVVNISGTASDPDSGDTVDVVEVNLDNGTWMNASGTASWYLIYDFTNISTGGHAIFARATDGKNYSKATVSYVYVQKIIVEPPGVTIEGSSYIAENIMELTGTSRRGNNSGLVDKVEIWADPLGYWQAAERKGPPLGNGTPSFDKWSWQWNTSGLEEDEYSVSARAWAGSLVSSIVNLEVEVQKFNHAPVITSYEPPSPVSMYEGSSRTFSIVAVDRDADPLTYSWTIDGQPKSTLSDPATITYKASYSSAGHHSVAVTVSDEEEENGTTSLTWDVTVLDGFVITDLTDLGDKVLDSGEVQQFKVAVLDPEGGKMSYLWSVDGQTDDCGAGPSYNFVYESTSAQQTKHTVSLKVTNSLLMSKELKWTVDVRGVSIDNGTGSGHDGGKGKGRHNTEGLAVMVIMAVLVVVSVFYMIYVLARGRKASVGAQLNDSPAPDVHAPAQIMPEVQLTGQYPGCDADQGYYQYPGQDQPPPGNGGGQ